MIRYPYLSIEILCNLGQSFLGWFLRPIGEWLYNQQQKLQKLVTNNMGSPYSQTQHTQSEPRTQKQHETAIKEEKPNMQQPIKSRHCRLDSKTTQIIAPMLQKDSQATLLCHMFQIMTRSLRLRETASGYLGRIIYNLQYNKPSDLFQHFVAHPHNLSIVIEHSYSKSMAEIICRLLTNEDESNNQKKIECIAQLFKNIQSEARAQQLTEKLENLAALIQQISQKSQQRYEGPKYLVLIENIITFANTDIIATIILKYGQHGLSQPVSLDQRETHNLNEQVVVAAIDVLLSFINHHQGLKSKQEKKRQAEASYDHMMNGTPLNNSRDQDSIQEDINIGIDENLTVSYSSLASQVVKFPFLSLSKMVTLKSFMLLRAVTNLHKESTRSIFNNRWTYFIRDLCVPLFRTHPNNNMLHNCIKGILMVAIEIGLIQDVCSPNTTLIDFIIQSFRNLNQEKASEDSQENIPLLVVQTTPTEQKTMEIEEIKPKEKPQIHKKSTNSRAENSFVSQLYLLAETIYKSSKKNIYLKEMLESEYPDWKQFLVCSFDNRRKLREQFLGGEDPHDKSDICTMNFGKAPELLFFTSSTPGQGEESNKSKSESEFFQLAWDKDTKSKLQINGIQEEINLGMESDDDKSSSSQSSDSDDESDIIFANHSRRKHKNHSNVLHNRVQEVYSHNSGSPGMGVDAHSEEMIDQGEVKIQQQICIQEEVQEVSS